MERAKEAFPFSDLHTELEQDKEFVELRERAKEVFNGRTVIDAFGIKGKELGKMLSNFNDTFDDGWDRNGWLVRNGTEAALERFKAANSDHFEDIDREKAIGDEFHTL